MTGDSDETRLFAAPGSAQPSAQLVGTTFASRYYIEKLIGVGAMGTVYLARHLKIGRRDAIKVLHSAISQDRDAMARFDRGARNVGAIRHPNVCTIYDFGDSDGVQYLAMEYIAGEALKDLIDRERRISVPRALHIAEQVALALQAAHDVGVVHRDLKPANIMILPGADGTDAVKVVDFDISKASTEDDEVTRLGYVIGTPEYMSPEQLWGGKLDGRSDVYSLAMVLYRALTGTFPFPGETAHDAMAARLSDTPPLRLAVIAPGVSFPPGLQELLDRALKLRAADRIGSAAEFAAQIRAVAVSQHTAASSVPSTLISAAASGGPLVANRQDESARRRLLIPITVAIALLAASVFAATKTGLITLGGSSGSGDTNSSIANSLQGPAPIADDTNNARIDTAGRPGSAAGAGRTERSQGGAAVRAPATGMNASNAANILQAQRERLLAVLASPIPDPATLRAMRDTAVTIHGLPGVADSERALAAHVAASASLPLGEPAVCVRWAMEAVRLAPTFPAYSTTLAVCRDAAG